MVGAWGARSPLRLVRCRSASAPPPLRLLPRPPLTTPARASSCRNGADKNSYPGDSGAITGPYTQFVINASGDAHFPKGSLFVSSTRYPVIEGLRTKESADPATEAVWSTVTKSSLTATRVSTLYTEAQMKAGYGTDVSFMTESADGVVDELGTVGFAHTGNGGPAADFIIKAW